MATVNTTRTITLRPGEKTILPAGAVVRSIVTEGSIMIESTCGGLPPVSQYKCGYFIYVRDDDADDGHPFDDYMKLSALWIGNKKYDLGIAGTNPTAADLNARLSDTALFKFTNVTIPADFTKRKYYAVFFRTPDTVFNDISLELDERGDGKMLSYVKPHEADCGSYSITL